jgi:hypothetical protein
MRPTSDLLSQEDRIRLRAAELSREHGGRPGSALDDWLRAETEIQEADQRSIDEALSPSTDAPVEGKRSAAERLNNKAEAEILGDQGQSGG